MQKPPSPDGSTAPRPGRSTQTAIDSGLKSLFAQIAEEPVPDDLLALLDRIDSAQPRGDAHGDGARP
ncbi:NepR family anti-sigma factor [Sandaracinobacteroides saxicola]|uniref:Anti-sigma factor NepR domain-containing protein n=1 Tax=Sandaracinobacteroides saxicola TaxID=2759707 RepID=A0A7G5IJC8_9SPHN|nr:NepR family anti-sigma factor [Sandaracinobacteroides saxicola]QMW23470.1 hypothetical protein H3309_02910 [Sandaracinobacteroides saxicola]